MLTCLLALIFFLHTNTFALEAEEKTNLFELGNASDVRRASKLDRCYKVDAVQVESEVAKMRDWLISYGAQVRVSAEIKFLLYIPPLSHVTQARALAERLRRLPEFAEAHAVTGGPLRKAVNVGQFSNRDANRLSKVLTEIGYQSKMTPIYKAGQAVVVRVLDQRLEIDKKDFQTAFPGYQLVESACL